MRIGILTGGGDAPGLNAAIRAVVLRATALGHETFGIGYLEAWLHEKPVIGGDIPPLREHKEDIPDLVSHFLLRFARDNGKEIEKITPAAVRVLMDYHWPGNVRQLENTIERAVALSTGSILDTDDIHLDSGSTRPQTAATAPVLPEGMTLEQWEDEIIREALRRANGNKSQAARMLGLSRNALRYRLSKIGVPDD